MGEAWVIKAGAATDNEPPEYLHGWQVDVFAKVKDPEWVTDQKMAFRFRDRNMAVKYARTFPICAYSDDVRVVRLTRHIAPGDDEEGA